MVESGRKSQMRGLGSYIVSIDAKNRIVLPVGIRKNLAEKESYVIIHKGYDDYLYLYTPEQWGPEYNRLMQLDDYDTDEKAVKRWVFNDLIEAELDSAGRILISKELKEYAKIIKEMKITSLGDRYEIWAEEVKAESERVMTAAEMKEIAKKVMKSKPKFKKEEGGNGE